jgi:hypothetical protein
MSDFRDIFRDMLRENVDIILEELAKRAPAAKSDKVALSVSEVATRTGLSQPTIRRRVITGAIPTVPGLNPTRIPADFVDRMINKANAR